MTKHQGKSSTIPEDWTAEVIYEKKKDPDDAEIDNRILILLFVSILVVVVAFTLLTKTHTASIEYQNTTVHGITIVAYKDPIAAVKGISSKTRIVASFLNEGYDSVTRDSILEIGSALEGKVVSSAISGYSIRVGLSDRTGIFVDPDGTTIEGKDHLDLWKATWVFDSIVADINIKPDDFYSFRAAFKNKNNVSVLFDLSEPGACKDWTKLSIANGNIQHVLGYLQDAYGYTVSQFTVVGDGKCRKDFTGEPMECPVESDESLIILFRKGKENSLGIGEGGNTILVEYAACRSTIIESVILRDLIAPDIVSRTGNVNVPDIAIGTN